MPFSDVLDEKLAECHPMRATEGASGAAVFPPALGFFYFASGPLAAATSRRVTRSVRPVPAPAGPRHPLTARQRQALEALVAFGAELGANFTADELRRAFRMLARRHHPDRHPASGEEERARQATLFAQVLEAYRHLQTVAGCN